MRFWIFLCRLGCYLWMRLHLYRVKSWIVRDFTEYMYISHPVSTYTSFRDLEAAMNRLTWTGDTWRQGWDAISLPGRIQALIDKARPEPGIDCDEFGVYIAFVLKRSIEAGHFRTVYRPMLCTVMWVDSKGKAGGHNVCLFEEEVNGKIMYAYMDYRMPVYGETKEAVVAKVRALYAGADAVSIGWALSDPDTLAPVEVHWA